MAKRVRTHRGRFIDLEEIKIKNQESVAVGNMNVNARGDQIDEYGRIVRDRDEISREHNKQFKSNTNARASVISAFEDEDDAPVELTDDPKAIERNTKKTSGNSQSKDNSKSSTSSGSSSNNSATKSTTTSKDSKGTSQTDLD